MAPVPKPARRAKSRPKDRVPPYVAAEVFRRDGYRCIAHLLGFLTNDPRVLTDCASQTGGPADAELDHVHPRGLSFRGLSIPSNLVTLCGRHHRDKTEDGRFWRALIDAYLATFGYKEQPNVAMG